MKRLKNIFRSKFIATAAGAFSALAFAPYHFFVAAVVSLSVLFLLLEKKENRKDVFWLGFLYGFGYFFAGTYWIANSLLVDAPRFGWLVPFALILIPAFLALYFAGFAVTYKFLEKKFHFTENFQRMILFSICWLVFEVLRSVLFTGFPWNLIGYIWGFETSFLQSASIFGIYGLSFFAVLVCLFPVLFIKIGGLKKVSEISAGDEAMTILLVLCISGALFFGDRNIKDSRLQKDEQFRLRLVQANIKQDMKWDEMQKIQNLLHHVELSKIDDLKKVKAVIWSETSVPYAVDNNQQLMHVLRQAIPPQGALVTGGLRLDFADENKSEIKNVWNSVFMIDEKGIVDSYDKHHLVPFGEYIPLQKFLPFVEKITDGAIGFSKGTGAKTMSNQHFSFSPLVCYEAIFSEGIVDESMRPALLVNLTNDAWFGNSSGPYQHLEMARVRAVEYGIPMARVANTGVTAYIDPFGRIVAQVGLNQEGVLDVGMIESLTPTIYEKHGHKPLIGAVLISLLLLVFGKKYRYKIFKSRK